MKFGPASGKIRERPGRIPLIGIVIETSMTTHKAGSVAKGDPVVAEPQTTEAGRGAWVARALTLALCLVHGGLVWIGLGGWEAFVNEWPPLRDDHGIHYHQAIVTRTFLSTTGATAGYDPSFMSGYPASIVSDLSSTLPDLVVWAFGATRPALAYKLYAFGCTALLPWLVATAAMVLRVPPRGVAVAVLLYLLYFWSDAPSWTAGLGMVSYVVSVPLGLLAVAAIVAFLDRGGFGRWAGAASACAIVFLVHVTSPMLVAPAGLVAYVVATLGARREGRRLGVGRHVGFWTIGPIVLAANAFWWVPGWKLASTKGTGMVAFANAEPVEGRLMAIFWSEGPLEVILLALGVAGLFAWWRRRPVAVTGVGAMMAVGFAWGYLAGFSRALDPLQPGRHTAALYTSASLAAGVFVDEALARLRAGGPGRLDRWVLLALALVGIRFLGPFFRATMRERLGYAGGSSFLSGQPNPQALRIVDLVKRHMRPGERLLYEEAGLSIPGQPSPFRGHHYSPVLPSMTGAEVIGGPYLHATVTTNFTQFGEGKLFGDPEWGRERFVRYARLYRPAAILCWSPRARGFCLANPDLVKVVEDDGVMLLGRVIGFEGATIRGKAEVEAGPNRIEVRNAVAGDDGLVVLRYHAVPLLESDPPVALEPVTLEDDPVPFIAFRPIGKTVVFRMRPW
jgi:hypothetical protein